MSQDHSAKLSFSIEESVWLNKGQEVDEILSLSLDPDITVQESGDYVLIRGGLKLTGEYRDGGSDAIEERESLTDQVAFRSIEEVTMNDDGTGAITHHFPIDVTIPKERIRSLDDIYVIVESFDYDLPERGCIQLTADIAITGMSNQTGVRDEVVQGITENEEEDRSFHYESYYQNTNEEEQAPFAFPQRNEASETSDNTVEEEEVVVDIDQEEIYQEVTSDELENREPIVAKTQLEAQVEEGAEVEVGNEAIIEETDVAAKAREEQQEQEGAAILQEIEAEAKETKAPTVAFGVIKERPKTDTEETNQVVPEKSFGMLKNLAATQKQVAVKEANRHEEQGVVKGEVQVTEITLEEGVETKKEQSKPPREENALYLTKMLTKGEEDFKKLKICIIQQNETLQTIAARYEVTESALIKVNKMNDAEVQEGQILYIPVTK